MWSEGGAVVEAMEVEATEMETMSAASPGLVGAGAACDVMPPTPAPHVESDWPPAVAPHRGTGADVDRAVNPRAGELRASSCGSDAPIRVSVTNVVASVNTGCAIDLMDVAIRGSNTQYFPRRQNVVALGRRGQFGSTCNVYPSGKVVLMGATGEWEARKSARRHLRHLQTLGYPVRFKDFRITNVCGASTFGHGISLETLAADLRGVHRVSYDPEHHPWLKVKTAAMTLMLFRSGSVTVTGAPSAAAISAELTALQPLVWRHRL